MQTRNASGRWSHPQVQMDARTKTVYLASAARRKRIFRTSEIRHATGDALSSDPVTYLRHSDVPLASLQQATQTGHLRLQFNRAAMLSSLPRLGVTIPVFLSKPDSSNDF
jgi:hypothetical protein